MAELNGQKRRDFAGMYLFSSSVVGLNAIRRTWHRGRPLNRIVRHRKTKIRGSMALLVLSSLVACQTPPSMPSPQRSEYLKTRGGSVLTDTKNDPGRMYIGATFDWLKQPPAGAIVVVEFAHEVRNGHERVLEMPVDSASSPLLTIRSPSYDCVVNHSAYVVKIKVYSDHTKSQVLGTHRQAIVFSVPSSLMADLKLKDCDA